jgi:hypothetical protein
MHPAQQEAAFSAMVHRILADYDDTGFQARMSDAYALLSEAEAFAPDDVTILLEKANVLVWLTPDDASDERAILQQVRHRLQAPQSDAERNSLAMALFSLATMGEQPDRTLLQEARNLFAGLGLQTQVAQCDALLSPPFNPVGQWQIQVGDGVGSVMQVWLQPDGTCTGTQQAGAWGGMASFAGHWGYDPNSKMLQMQVLVNGFQPYALGIVIEGEQAGGYAGRGTDGFGYFMMRVG